MLMTSGFTERGELEEHVTTSRLETSPYQTERERLFDILAVAVM